MIEGVQQNRHVEESTKLEPQPYVELLQMTMNPPGLSPTVLTLTALKQVVWQGITWESYAVALIGYSQESSGEVSRPSFSISNPNGIFSRYVHAKWTDNAEVIRYRVLKEHVDGNINSYVKHTWRVAKCSNLGSKVAVFELRGAMDGQFFIIPGRGYYPPEFPTVSL